MPSFSHAWESAKKKGLSVGKACVYACALHDAAIGCWDRIYMELCNKGKSKKGRTRVPRALVGDCGLGYSWR